MPTYDYECKSCEHKFELFQSITEPVKRKCPQCKRNTLRRLFGTGAALLFKGSGFYQTDYRSESYRKGAEADKKAADGGTGKAASGTGSDGKSADGKSGEGRAEGGRAGRGAGTAGRKKSSATDA